MARPVWDGWQHFRSVLLPLAVGQLQHLPRCPVGFKKYIKHIKTIFVQNDEKVVSVGLQWTDRKIVKIITMCQRELFKNIPRLGTFCTQSVNEGLIKQMDRRGPIIIRPTSGSADHMFKSRPADWLFSLLIVFLLVLVEILAFDSKLNSHLPATNPLSRNQIPPHNAAWRDFLLGILLLEPFISLIHAWKTKKCNNYSFSLSIMYGSSYMFRHYVAILSQRS
jgi:hypothetical protein